MPQFNYRGRDKEGRLRIGQRFALNTDNLNAELLKEGISVIQITASEHEKTYWHKILDLFQSESVHLEELAIFARQMQLLHQANVPIITAIKQLGEHTRSHRLAYALLGLIEHLEKGQPLSASMAYYPETFSPLIANITQMGERTGHLSEAFGYINQYLEFESRTIKQIKSAFRYPLFVLSAIIFAFIVLNVFVIPTFARFYVNLEVSLPWQTRFLIGTSYFFTHYGIYLLISAFIGSIFIYRYLKTPHGKYRWNHYELHIPFLGKLLKRIILIRFTQSFAIILNAGISVTQGLVLIKQIINNAYVAEQISEMQMSIERGVAFTPSIEKVTLFSPIEIQILAVGEKNGELSPALTYIANFHNHEIDFDLKKMNDLIGPILISAIAILILVVALGVYLPIWNMINLVHS